MAGQPGHAVVVYGIGPQLGLLEVWFGNILIVFAGELFLIE
jgi:hypothetical protein